MPFILSLALVAVAPLLLVRSVAPKVGPTSAIKFDEYNRISFKEEKKRLNNFAISLREQPGAKGYIVVRDGPSGNQKKLKWRGCRAVKYLLEHEKVSSERVGAAMGIVSEEWSRGFTVELWIYPGSVAAPLPWNVKPETAITFTGSEAKAKCGW